MILIKSLYYALGECAIVLLTCNEGIRKGVCNWGVEFSGTENNSGFEKGSDSLGLQYSVILSGLPDDINLCFRVPMQWSWLILYTTWVPGFFLVLRLARISNILSFINFHNPGIFKAQTSVITKIFRKRDYILQRIQSRLIFHNCSFLNCKERGRFSVYSIFIEHFFNNSTSFIKKWISFFFCHKNT